VGGGSVPPPSNPPQAGGGSGGGAAEAPLSLSNLARTLTLSRTGRLTLRIQGEPGTSGRITVVSARKVKVGRKRKKLTLGRASFRLGGNGTAKVSMRVSGSSRRVMSKLKRVRAAVTATAAGQRAATARVTVKAPKPKRKRRG
jgi:hypothetical protein